MVAEAAPVKATVARGKSRGRPKRVRKRLRPRGASWEFEVQGDFDRRQAEALRLDIWELARRHGMQVRGLRVESVG